MTGYKSKKAMAQGKEIVTDIDGHVVRDARKPKKAAALDRDAEIERLNEKIEFLARTNMLYSDWEHRDTQVTSDLIRKGIEEAKINTELRAEIAELKAQLVAQPEQERLPNIFCKGRNCTASEKNGFNHSPECIVDTAKVQGWSSAPEAIKAAAAIKEALAQPAQEPMQYNCTVIDDTHPNGIPLSQWGQQAPQRPWVGLTDEEIDVIYEQHHNQYGECESPNFGYERAIEAKLKERNT